jgi:hypothetical protein
MTHRNPASHRSHTMATDFHIIKIRNGSHVRSLVVYHAIPTQEVSQLLRSAFQIASTIVGLKDVARQISYPLSLVSMAPGYFAEGIYDLVGTLQLI